VNRRIQRYPAPFEQLIERLGLGHRARKAIEDKPTLAVSL
jgi:hypothetical protein